MSLKLKKETTKEQIVWNENSYKYFAIGNSICMHGGADYYRKWGLERGDSINITGAKYRNTEQYRRDLSKESTALEKSIGEKSATLRELNQQIRQAEIRIKGLTTMTRNLEASKAAIEQELDTIHATLSGGEMDSEQRASLSQKEESLQKKLADILARLADKQAKLAHASGQLAQLQKQLSEAKAQNESLGQQVQNARAEVSQNALNKVSAEALWGVLNEFMHLRSSLPTELTEQMEDSLLEDMVSRGMNIIACAALLSMGMVDQATDFAKNCGGRGGGGSSGCWGRDPKEDEREWIRRCLAQSRKMMRPAGQKMRR